LAGLAGSAGSTGLMSVLRSLSMSMPLSLAGIGSMVAVLASASNPAGWLNSLASVVPTSAVPVLGEVQGLLGVIGGLTRFAGVDSFGTSANVLATSVPFAGLLDTAGAGTVHAVTGIATGGGSPWLP
jgi:hypothetical protein